MQKKSTKEINDFEIEVSKFFRVSQQIDENTLSTKNRHLFQIIEVEGVNHLTADNSELNTWTHSINKLLKTIADANTAVWSHVVRKRSDKYPKATFSNNFSKELDENYKAKVTKGELYTNRLYLTIILTASKSSAGMLDNVVNLFTLDSDAHREAEIAELNGRLEKLHNKVSDALSLLSDFQPRVLGCYEQEGVYFSEPLELIGELINVEHQKYPVNPLAELSETIPTNRPYFTKKDTVFAVRREKDYIYGGALTIKDYPSEKTQTGMLDTVLNFPFEAVLTQSFTVVPTEVAKKEITEQRDRLTNAGDFGVSQIEALEFALDDLVSGKIVFGQHHMNLIVYGDSRAEVKTNLSDAKGALTQKEIFTNADDVVNEYNFYAQIPANFGERTRVAIIHSYNFACFNSFHNFPSDHLKGNWWGDAISMLKTTSGTPYYFNFHVRTGDYPPANTVIIGPTGVGKTTLMGFLLAQANRVNPHTGKSPKMFLFDKDRGASILIKAMGGKYTAIKDGVPTGFNFLQMEATEKNVAFMNRMVKQLMASRGITANTDDVKIIHNSIEGLLKLDYEHRTISNLIDGVPQGSNVEKGLESWVSGGASGWVFDNENDTLNLNCNIVGFDMTEILDDDSVRTPIVMYLFHRMNTDFIDGSPCIVPMDEFWKLINDPVFAPEVKDQAKTIRKRDGFTLGSTQEPDDLVDSPIGKTIVNSSVTQIFLPNPKANESAYMGHFKLSQAEYDTIKSLGKNSRQFLIKKGNQSVVAELDLAGMDNEIAVLSGSQRNADLMDSIIEEVGDNPNDWLPIFHERRS